MSEATKEVVRDAEVGAEIAPILEGLHKMSDEIIRTRKSAEDQAKSVERKVEDLEAKTNKSLEDVIGRIGRLKDHSTVLGKALLNIGPGNDALVEIVPKSFKDHAWAYEAAANAIKQQQPDSPLGDPTVAMAVAAWFSKATRASLRKFASSMQEDASDRDKLFNALQERHFGSNWQAITKAALQEDTAAEGGNLVPTIVESTILRQIKDAGRLFPLARQFQMTKKTHQIPSETTAVTVNWVAEEGTLTGGEPNFGQKTLTAIKLAGRATMSIELVEDSNPGLLSYLLEVFSEKMAGELDKQVVCGDGSSPAITGINGASGINVVSTSATAAGRNLTWQLLVNTYVGANEGAAIENGYWIVSPKGYSVIFGLSDSTGQPIVKFGDTQNAPFGTILGRPILLSARWGGAPSGVTATLDDSTNTNTRIIYGPPSSVAFGTRTGMRWDVTDQVNWATYQMDARLVGRFAAVVGVPADFSRLTKINYT